MGPAPAPCRGEKPPSRPCDAQGEAQRRWLARCTAAGAAPPPGELQRRRRAIRPPPVRRKTTAWGGAAPSGEALHGEAKHYRRAPPGADPDEGPQPGEIAASCCCFADRCEVVFRRRAGQKTAEMDITPHYVSLNSEGCNAKPTAFFLQSGSPYFLLHRQCNLESLRCRVPSRSSQCTQLIA